MHRLDGVWYYLAEDVAGLFEVEKNTVNQWVKRGIIIPTTQVRIGRYLHNLFNEQAVKDCANKKYGSQK